MVTVQRNLVLVYVSLWCLLFLAVGVVFCMATMSYNFMDAVYLTVSTLTDIGIANIPYDVDDWIYLAVALYSIPGLLLVGVVTLVAAEYITTNAPVPLKPNGSA